MKRPVKALKEIYPGILLVALLMSWGLTGHTLPSAAGPAYARQLLEWDWRTELRPWATETPACPALARGPADARSWCEAGDRPEENSARAAAEETNF